MTGHEIRKKFLSYFNTRGHRVIGSSSLVPDKDPTLLFANAGMNQFKDVFLGLEQKSYTRATTSQKCVRAGGKHNDLENVGRTRRHHTFFEMLGNFSFGDYFKSEAIEFAWELITKEYSLPKELLYVTVFENDDEAEKLWKTVTNIQPDHIFRCGTKENFWQMGDTGPCGPCSEIFYDFGPTGLEPGERDTPFPSEISRYVEIWNLVFMQFERDSDGNLNSLPSPSIDTGMGLERIAAVLQGKLSNFDTDLILPVINKTAELLGNTTEYGLSKKVDTTLRIIADHSRAATFLIHDGVLPANEGRGYVLRKIIRRALRHARLIGHDTPFLHQLTDFVADLMKPGYPEVVNSVPQIRQIIKDEEFRYQNNYALAEKMFEKSIHEVKNKVLPGKLAFKLYDTFGLSIDEQGELATERGLTIDSVEFTSEMEKQRVKARASWKGAKDTKVPVLYQSLVERYPTIFDGYTKVSSTNTRILAIIDGQKLVQQSNPNTTVEVILDRTPFYAESGGQVSDHGNLSTDKGVIAAVEDVQTPIRGLYLHQVTTINSLQVGDAICCQVDVKRRNSVRRNHTATHLLHAALRKTLGTHVKQAGSIVSPRRLRFDITHYAPITPGQLKEIEEIVNNQVLLNTPVTTEVMEIDDALKTGAMALFGEKYDDQVRVVQVADFSTELCGGTHVVRTGDIGLFKIVGESSISSGVRRIEAITGITSYEHYHGTSLVIDKLSSMLGVPEPNLVDSVERLNTERKDFDKEIQQLKSQLVISQSSSLVNDTKKINGINVLLAKVDGLDRKQMRTLADSLRNRLQSGVVVLGTIANGTTSLISVVTKDIAGKKVHAGKLVSALAREIDGRGGGRADMAEAGGKNTTSLAKTLQKAYRFVDEQSSQKTEHN